jgi:hypothetical protein
VTIALKALTSQIGGGNAFLKCKSLSIEDRRVLQGYVVVGFYLNKK